eukprot:9078802-Lingulodinium_polyedra.AAC.1
MGRCVCPRRGGRAEHPAPSQDPGSSQPSCGGTWMVMRCCMMKQSWTMMWCWATMDDAGR